MGHETINKFPMFQIFSVLASLAILTEATTMDLKKLQEYDARDVLLEEVQFHGYLQVSLEMSHSIDQSNDSDGHKTDLNQSDVSLKNLQPQLILCLVKQDFQDKSIEWKESDCRITNVAEIQVYTQNDDAQSTATMIYETIHFPLRSDNPITYMVATKSSRVRDVDINNPDYWSYLPLMFPNSNVMNRLTMISNQGTNGSILEATLLLFCAANQFGPRCAITCIPPTSRHLCDKTSGELKCLGTWSGKNCEKNVFLGREEAFEFIQHRNKRANSYLHTEEYFPGNIEQECGEELCSYEEAREAFENDELTKTYWKSYNDTNQCQPNPCVANHTLHCKDLVGDYSCHCLPGYSGKDCQEEVNVCLSEPCKHEAVCQRLGSTSFECLCRPGYRGSLCEIDIDECSTVDCGLHGACEDGVDSYSCVCDGGYEGSFCEQEINECSSNPCQNGGVCTDFIGYYKCTCSSQYNGVNCENMINPCLSTPCMNEGECREDQGYNFYCICLSEFTGPLCQHTVNNPCSSHPCLNNGTCYVIKNDITEKVPLLITNHSSINQDFNCICNTGFEGKSCERTISACDLAEATCPSNATCTSLDRQYICHCPDGYTGNMCQVPGNDSEVQEHCQGNPCTNGGRCLYDGSTTTCNCRSGYNGKRCDYHININYCHSSPCINDGVCLSTSNGFLCNCPQGFNGTYCENDIDECSYGAKLCQNEGRCNNTIGSFHCLCGPYNAGRYCQYEYDPCDFTPCQNGGACYHDLEEYGCDCLEGYGGYDCIHIINPCTDVTNPCENEAICSIRTDDPSQADCACPQGFHGRFCQHRVDHCIPLNEPGNTLASPCGENGDCFSELTGFKCDCHKGYIGERCETAFNLPVVNCTLEHCSCPSELIKEVESHGNNASSLQCRYQHHEQGYCLTPTCLAQSCTNKINTFYCTWSSACLESYLSNRSITATDSDKYCSIIELKLDQMKLPQETTVHDFCNKVRQLSSYARFRKKVKIHCGRKETDEQNSSLAISFDSETSLQDATILAATVFQRLQQELSDEPSLAADDLDPLFSSIYYLSFNGQVAHVQNPTDKDVVSTVNVGDPEDKSVYITIPLILTISALLGLFGFIFIRCRRRNDLTKSQYNARPRLQVHPDSEVATESVYISSDRAQYCKNSIIMHKREENSGFANAAYSYDEDTNTSVASSARRHYNSYVPTSALPSSSLAQPSATLSSKTVGENTVAFIMDKNDDAADNDGYLNMKIRPLPGIPNYRLDQEDEAFTYIFAQECTAKIPILRKAKFDRKNDLSKVNNKSTSSIHPFTEIDLETYISIDSSSQIVSDSQVCETAMVVSDSQESIALRHTNLPGCSIAHTFSSSEVKTCNSISGQIEGLYEELIGSLPSGRNAIGNSNTSCRKSNISQWSRANTTDHIDENQSPSPLFPQHDNLFFPNKIAEIPFANTYSIPR